MNTKEIKDMLDSYDMGMITANQIIDTFIGMLDENGKINDVQYRIVQKRDKLVKPLADAIATMLEAMI